MRQLSCLVTPISLLQQHLTAFEGRKKLCYRQDGRVLGKPGACCSLKSTGAETATSQPAGRDGQKAPKVLSFTEIPLACRAPVFLTSFHQFYLQEERYELLLGCKQLSLLFHNLCAKAGAARCFPGRHQPPCKSQAEVRTPERAPRPGPAGVTVHLLSHGLGHLLTIHTQGTFLA